MPTLPQTSPSPHTHNQSREKNITPKTRRKRGMKNEGKTTFSTCNKYPLSMASLIIHEMSRWISGQHVKNRPSQPTPSAITVSGTQEQEDHKRKILVYGEWEVREYTYLAS